ncbi:MAG TPA: HNH endonuclease [Candidatus Latescibacteria bacterium]|nr:HNH endonuclease [Candidatus Latescibacterota bacterium]
MLNQQVLVLNENYEPLNVCTARRAIIMVFCGKAEVVEKHNNMIRSISMAFPLPSIVRLASYVHHPFKKLALSKRNIFKRDGRRCQYCGTSQGPMTIDHVIPRRLGGEDTWENLVCACIRCNNKKGDRPPEEAGLRLLKPPRKPGNVTFIGRFIEVTDHRWKPYLFME